MGCVALSERFFRDGKISAKRIERARLAARMELEPVQAAFRRRGWEHAVGSSGTVRAIGEAIRALDPQALTITPEGLAARDRLLRATPATSASSTSSRSPRTAARCSPAGSRSSPRCSACSASKEMRVADGAMREGLLYDMVGRYKREDARERTVRSMQQRYHVDTEQAERVEAHGASTSSSRSRETWELEDPLARPGAALGRAAARDRPRRLAHRLSPPRRLPARERRHAGLPARGAAAAGAPGRRAPPQADARPHRGAGAALGPQRACT